MAISDYDLSRGIDRMIPKEAWQVCYKDQFSKWHPIWAYRRKRDAEEHVRSLKKISGNATQWDVVFNERYAALTDPVA